MPVYGLPWSLWIPFVHITSKNSGIHLFGRRSQVGVPLVVSEFDGKDFKTLFVGTIKN